MHIGVRPADRTDCKKQLNMWNEAWDQCFEPDRIEVSQPDRPEPSVGKKQSKAAMENGVLEIVMQAFNKPF